MENALISWITSLISGGAGGNVAGVLLKDKNLGPILNSILGAIGGAAGGQLLPMILTFLQQSGIAGNIGGSAIGGIVLTVLGTLVKGAMKPK